VNVDERCQDNNEPKVNEWMLMKGTKTTITKSEWVNVDERYQDNNNQKLMSECW
jgi:hypothetical protein